MKKISIIIFLIYISIIGLYPFEEVDNSFGRFILMLLMIIYPSGYYIHHKFISLLKIYIKDYLNVIFKDIEEKVGKDFVNKIIMDVIFPFNVYSINDFYKLIDKIGKYIDDNLALSEEVTNELLDFIENDKFEDYLKKIEMKKRVNSLSGVTSENSWENLFIRLLNFYDSGNQIWKYTAPKISSILFIGLIIFDIYIVCSSVTFEIIFFELLLTITFYLFFSFKKNKVYDEYIYFILYWPYNVVMTAFFTVNDMSGMLFMNPIVLILFSIKFLLSIIWGNKIINIVFNIKEEEIHIERKDKVYYRIINIIKYKAVNKCKYFILWLMFIFIIAFNIIDFSFINYANIKGIEYTYFSNAHVWRQCLKHSILNYFTNTPFFDFTYQNDFLINIFQSIIAYFTNILLITNIVKYLTEPSKYNSFN